MSYSTNQIPLRLGIIGGGEAAQKAISALHGFADIDIVAVCCLKHELLGAVPASLRRTVDSILAATDVEAVYVATPVESHAPLAVRALRAGKHVLIEKPLALSVHDGMDIRRSAAADTVSGVAFKKRFNASLRLAREKLRSLPRAVLEMRWHIPLPATPWRYERARAGGGVVMDLGSHVLDLFEYLLGDIVAISRVTIVSPDPSAVEQAARVEVVLGLGHSGVMELGWTTGKPCQTLIMRSDDVCITVDRPVGSDSDILLDNREPERRVQTPCFTEYRGLFAAFRDAVRGRSSDLPAIDAGLRNLRLIADVYRAAERRVMAVPQ